MKMIVEQAVESWGKTDVEDVAKEAGVKLTDAEAQKVLELMCKNYDKKTSYEFIKKQIQTVVADRSTAETKPTTSTPTVNSACVNAAFNWFFHSSTKKNETKDAVAIALSSGRPLLLYVAKPGCAVCEKVWTDQLKATGKFKDYMKKNGIVGLKIEDTASHFTDLAKAKNSYAGLDGVKGNKINSTAPFLLFIKVKKTASAAKKITLSKDEVDVFLSGYGKAKMSDKDYDKITKWLDSIMSTSEFKKLFQ